MIRNVSRSSSCGPSRYPRTATPRCSGVLKTRRNVADSQAAVWSSRNVCRPRSRNRSCGISTNLLLLLRPKKPVDRTAWRSRRTDPPGSIRLNPTRRTITEGNIAPSWVHCRFSQIVRTLSRSCRPIFCRAMSASCIPTQDQRLGGCCKVSNVWKPRRKRFGHAPVKAPSLPPVRRCEWSESERVRDARWC